MATDPLFTNEIPPVAPSIPGNEGGPFGAGPDVEPPATSVVATQVDGTPQHIVTVQSSEATKAPFGIVVSDTLFNVTHDQVMEFGYNVAGNGGKVTAADHRLAWVIEQDYEVSPGVHWTESYIEYTKAAAAAGANSYRPIFIHLDVATGVLGFELNSTEGISFATTDGLQTQWGVLSSTGLHITPYAGQDAALLLDWKTGGSNFIQINNGAGSLILQPSASGSTNWVWSSGGIQAVQFNPTQFQVAKDAWIGFGGGGASLKMWNIAAGSQAAIIGNNGSDGILIGATNTWTGITFQPGGATSLLLAPSGLATFYGDVALGTAGKGLKVAEGANAKMGVATLVAGTVVVPTTAVTAVSRILLTVQSLGTVLVPQAVGVTARTVGTSFTITSAGATDTSVVAWFIVEPA